MNVRSAETWRVFCAIDLPQAVRKIVLEHIAGLQARVPDARAAWAREANLHLTIKFVGEIPPTSVPPFSTAVSRAVAVVNPFSINLEQTGAFPKQGQPRVLWIGINDVSGNLRKLHQCLEDESASEGFAKEARPLRPHLTIARLRQPLHSRLLAAAHQRLEFEPLEIAVSELLVIRSELSSAGSKYTAVSRHALGRSDKL